MAMSTSKFRVMKPGILNDEQMWLLFDATKWIRQKGHGVWIQTWIDQYFCVVEGCACARALPHPHTVFQIAEPLSTGDFWTNDMDPDMPIKHEVTGRHRYTWTTLLTGTVSASVCDLHQQLLGLPESLCS